MKIFLDPQVFNMQTYGGFPDITQKFLVVLKEIKNCQSHFLLRTQIMFMLPIVVYC